MHILFYNHLLKHKIMCPCGKCQLPESSDITKKINDEFKNTISKTNITTIPICFDIFYQHSFIYPKRIKNIFDFYEMHISWSSYPNVFYRRILENVLRNTETVLLNEFFSTQDIVKIVDESCNLNDSKSTFLCFPKIVKRDRDYNNLTNLGILIIKHFYKKGENYLECKEEMPDWNTIIERTDENINNDFEMAYDLFVNNEIFDIDKLMAVPEKYLEMTAFFEIMISSTCYSKAAKYKEYNMFNKFEFNL